MKSKKSVRILSFALVFALVVQIFPIAISAEKLGDSVGAAEQAPFYSSENTEEINLTEKEILFEDTEKRTETEKHYKMNDGSFMVAKYPEPIHYLDDNNQWKDIDNTLEFEPASEDNGSGEYVNRSNYFDVRFSEDTTDENLFTLSKEDSSVSVKLNEDNSRLSQAQTAGNEAALFSLQSKKALTIEEKNQRFLDKEKLSSEITYNDVFPDIDYQYVVLPNGIKENIIINKAKSEYIFNFGLDITGLELQEHEDGSLSLLSNGEVEFSIPAPFMFDADGKYSEAVHYEVAENSDGSVNLKIVADPDWINQEDIVFPVTVDPIINTNTEGVDIQDSHVNNASGTVVGDTTNINYGNSSTVNIGYQRVSAGNYMKYRTYVQWSALPLLKNSDIVVSASLNYYQQSINATEPMVVEAHAVTNSWAESSVTWKTQPVYSTEVLDYTEVSSSTANKYVSWNITKAIKEWYKNWQSNGIALISGNESMTQSVSFSSAENINSSRKPYILVNYRSNKGIEDYWTYTSSDAGKAGTVYINNYNGNSVIVRNDFTSQSSLMPFTIKHVYNSYMAGMEFTSSTYAANTCSFDGMYVGQGWKLSVQESIVPVSILEWGVDSKYSYIYNDEDGTDHYFALNNEGKYVDESGLGMILEVTANQYILKTAEGYKKTFKIVNESRASVVYKNGYIISTEDEYGNKIEYVYSSSIPSRLISIKDPSGTTANFNYDSTNHLTSITIGSQVITYTYYRGTLLGIDDNLGCSAEYLYSAQDICSSAKDNAGKTVNIEYDKYSYEVYRAKTMAEKTAATAVANGVSISYSDSNSTSVQYYGNDAVKSTGDDIFNSYVFDNMGRTVLTYSENADRTNVYGTNISEPADKGSVLTYGRINNNVSKLATTGMTSVNLITGGNFEGTGLYSFNVTNPDKNRYAYTDESYVGSKSVNCTINVEDSEVSGLNRPISNLVKTGKKYTLSAYVKRIDGGTGNIVLKATSGSTTKISDSVSKTDKDIENGWQRLSVDFDCVSVNTNIYLGLQGGTGSFYIDAVQLELASDYTPTNFNLISNSGFEPGIEDWTLSNTSNVAVTSASSDVKFGSKALKITGNSHGVYTFKQTVNVGNLPKHSFILSGWAKANSLSPESNENSTFGLFADVKYIEKGSNGVETEKTETTKIPFLWSSGEWQYVSGAIMIPEAEPGTKIIKIVSMTVGGEYSNNINTAIFDNITLSKGTATKINYDNSGSFSSIIVDGEYVAYDYDYDSNGNIVKISDRNSGSIVNEYVYSGKNLTQVKDKDGNVIESHEYDANNRPVFSLDKSGTRTSYSYNTLGQVTSITNPHESEYYSYTSYGNETYRSVSKKIDNVLKSITTSSSYDSTTKNLMSETDERGKTVNYLYDSNFQLNMYTDKNGNKTGYDHTSSNFISRIYADKNKNGVYDSSEPGVQYTYDSLKRVSGINSVTAPFSFVYNSAGLLEQTKIGTKLFSKNTYNSAGTLLTGVEYCNGFIKGFGYDSLGNLTDVKYGDIVKYKYKYNNNQQLTKLEDVDTGLIHEYLYDGTGNQNAYILRGSNYTYKKYFETDSNNEVSEVNKINDTALKYKEKTVETTENGKTVQTEKLILPTNTEIYSKYDDFGRKKTTYFDKLSNDYSYTYSYLDGATANSTTNIISGISYSNQKGTSSLLKYTYDANGNIETVVEDNVLKETYVYDELNQLIRNNSVTQNKTFVYEYNSSGNILSRKTYSYTNTEALGTLEKTDTYTYGDSDWGDVLTKYNGKSILGGATPVVYNINNKVMIFSWDGYQLKSISNGGGSSFSDLQYKYNADGLRTQKIIDGSLTEYILDEDRIVATKKGNNYVYFMYDDNGSPVGMNIGGTGENTAYYFIKNLQGDIVKVIDYLGNIAATYTYDAWGNPVTQTGIDSVLNNNIFRYRGYIYDKETGFYYLNSRYYDPNLGRFIGPDRQINSGILGANTFAYSENNPVNMSDHDGNASYKNSYYYNSRGGSYRVTTTISFWYGTKLTYNYYITKKGIVRFEFPLNNYWSVLWRGESKTLATAMYKVAKSINSNFLWGRSIGGIDVETKLHWAAYTMNIKRSSSEVADMGGTNSRKTGYDDNAWFFEGWNAASIVRKMNINNVWNVYSLIRDISRYF